jgi:predicted dienelactone hydrolase
MNTLFRIGMQIALMIGVLSTSSNALSQTRSFVGFHQTTIGSTKESGLADAIDIAIWYPTRNEEKSLTLGPTTMNVAFKAVPISKKHPLIVVSHGTGGMNLNYHEIASAAAKAGFIVLALTHPRDNHKDRSMVGQIDYFTERPRQVSRAVDAFLADPNWFDLVDSDRIGFIGHSAGGFTGLALLGATPSIANAVKHCAENYDDDTWFCSLSGSKQKAIESVKNLTNFPTIASSVDRRFKAAVLIAPLGAFNDGASLTAINSPTLVYVAEKDNVLVPKFHAEAVAAGISNAQMIKVNQGGHFMLVSKLNIPAGTTIEVNGAEVNSDPPGFSRADAIAKASEVIPKWFSEKLK